MQPAISAEEAELAARAAREDPRFVAALRRRGIEDPQRVQVDPLSVGSYPHLPQGRRILWATPYLRAQPTDNGYARPIENLRACVDIATGEVLEVLDGDAGPALHGRRQLREAAVRRGRTCARSTSSQPDGAELRARRPRAALAGLARARLLAPDRRARAGRRRATTGRPILHRAALAEMVVPYGDPDEGFYWRSYFDAGEYGLGRDHDAARARLRLPRRDPLPGRRHGRRRRRAAHDRQRDLHPRGGRRDPLEALRHGHRRPSEVRRSRRLVVSYFATVGNYDYGFYWYCYLDGSIELEVRLTGIVLTRGVRPGEPLRHATRLAPDLAAPHHQHLFNVRLDMAVDGPSNRVYEVDMVAVARPASGAARWSSARR